MECLKMHWVPEQSSCAKLSWGSLWRPQKRKQQQQQTLRPRERRQTQRWDRERTCTGVIKGKQGGVGSGEKVETSRKGAKKCRKKKGWRNSGAKGKISPWVYPNVCEHKKVAGYFWGGIFGTWLILGVNGRTAGWMGAKSNPFWAWAGIYWRCGHIRISLEYLQLFICFHKNHEASHSNANILPLITLQ